MPALRAVLFAQEAGAGAAAENALLEVSEVGGGDGGMHACRGLVIELLAEFASFRAEAGELVVGGSHEVLGVSCGSPTTVCWAWSDGR